jgi:hypothetical protein
LDKGKEPAAKGADKEPLFDDNKFTIELLRSTFRKLEGVGKAFDIKAHHDVYKDLSVKGLAFRIHGLVEKLENLPVVKRDARRHFFFGDGGSDSDDGNHNNDVSLFRISFNYTLESLPPQQCSQPFTGNSFAIDLLGNLFPFPVLLILSLPLLFLEMMTTLLWSCLDGGVSVSLWQTNTKTNTLEPNTCVSLVFSWN